MSILLVGCKNSDNVHCFGIIFKHHWTSGVVMAPIVLTGGSWVCCFNGFGCGRSQQGWRRGDVRCGTVSPCLNVCTVIDLTYLTIVCAWICWYFMCMERWDDIYYGNSCHSSDFVVTSVTAGCHNGGLWSPRRRTSLALYALRLLLGYIVGYDWDGFFYIADRFPMPLNITMKSQQAHFLRSVIPHWEGPWCHGIMIDITNSSLQSLAVECQLKYWLMSAEIKMSKHGFSLLLHPCVWVQRIDMVSPHRMSGVRSVSVSCFCFLSV